MEGTREEEEEEEEEVVGGVGGVVTRGWSIRTDEIDEALEMEGTWTHASDAIILESLRDLEREMNHEKQFVVMGRTAELGDLEAIESAHFRLQPSEFCFEAENCFTTKELLSKLNPKRNKRLKRKAEVSSSSSLSFLWKISENLAKGPSLEELEDALSDLGDFAEPKVASQKI